LYYIDLRQNITPEIYIGYNTARAPLGSIVLTYLGKSVNIIAGGKGEGVVYNEEGAAAALTSNNSLGEDLSSDGSFRIDGQRLYNLAIHNNYTAHSIVIDIKGKGFQFYTFIFG
jgi:hypothetical protein